MKVRDLLRGIDEVAPFSLAAKWDNVGLMIGDPESEVHRLAIALDPLPEAIEEARRMGCQALLTHHPLFFNPLRSLNLATDPGRAVEAAIRCGVAVLTAHTNWDSVRAGVSWTLAELLGLRDIAPLEPAADKDGAFGLGAVGLFEEKKPLAVCLNQMKTAWNLTQIDCYASPNCCILKVALCGGSGGDLWPRALEHRTDLYITADMKYHSLLDATRAGLSLAVVDHAEMESVSMNALAQRLERLEGLELMLLNVRGLPPPLRL
ncbi:MAG: Nif3-like dinuclear metal center hexameric protein [Fretibacterium sp.]|nr:Nif3-like dinuclear metal center hexameric protein [Fretibacterium sp.]